MDIQIAIDEVMIGREKRERMLTKNELKNSDIVFNALHGTIGEDGTIQSWLDKNNLPYTGSDSDSSRRCMNKDQSKSIVRENNFLTPDWLLIEKKN